MEAHPLIFVSYAYRDTALALAFAKLMRDGCGLRPDEVFVAGEPGSIQPGQLFTEEIRVALTASEMSVHLLSPSYYASQFCLAEMGAAWIRKIPHIPILVPPSDFRAIAGVELGRQALRIDNGDSLDVVRNQVSDALSRNKSPHWSKAKTAFLDEWAGTIAPSDPWPVDVVLAGAVARESRYVFSAGVQALRAKHYSRIRIFAPTGVWEVNFAKRRWFAELAEALRNANTEEGERAADPERESGQPAMRVGSLTAYYGLPPFPRRIAIDPNQSESYDVEGFRKDLEHAESTLRPLHNLRNAKLFWMPADMRSVPGTGLIDFDGEQMVLGFAVGHRHAMDGAIVLGGRNLAVDLVRDWFDTHLVDQHASVIPLQDLAYTPPGERRCVPICVNHGFNVIRRIFAVNTKIDSVQCDCDPMPPRVLDGLIEEVGRRLGLNPE